MTSLVRFRVDFTDQCSIGPGKIDLLEKIRDSGSLSQAGRELDMSYRRAWLLLDSLNTSFREPVVSTSVGGSEGGGARLTEFGERLIELYRQLEAEFNSTAARRFREIGAAVAVKKNASALRTPLVRSRAPRRVKAKPRGRAAKRP